MTTRTQYESPDHLTDVVERLHTISKDHEATLKAIQAMRDAGQDVLADAHESPYQDALAWLIWSVDLVEKWQKEAAQGNRDMQARLSDSILKQIARTIHSGGRLPVDDVDPKAA